MEDSAASIPSIWASMNSWCTPTVLFVFLNLMIGTILFTSNLPNNHHKPEDQKEKPQNESTQSKLARSPSILHRLRSFNLNLHRSQTDSSPATQQQQESLETAATQYVFDHPFPHESVSTQTENLDLNPTRFEPFEQEPGDDSAQYDGFNHTNEIQPANVQTHFVFEPKYTVERVITHFDFDSAGGESDTENQLDSGFVDTHEEEKDQFQSLDEVYSSITGGHVNRTKSDTVPASGEVPVKLPAKMKKSASLKSAFSHFEEEKIVEARRPATVRERRSAAKAADASDGEVDARADDFINKFKQQLQLQRLDSIIRYKDMVNRGSTN